MKRIAILAAFATALAPLAAGAQSTLTLEDFDLGNKPAAKPASPPAGSDMEKCLLDSAACTSKEFGGSSKFSIDDVVNLGIIDREEVKAKPAAASGNSPAPAAEPLPSSDIEVLFDYDSDQLRPDQFGRLSELAAILRTDRFSGFKFAFLGHSDAKGADTYNLDLSKRRALVVAQFVNQVSGIPASRFVATGLGAKQLKTPSDPFGPANRRVQLLLVPVR